MMFSISLWFLFVSLTFQSPPFKRLFTIVLENEGIVKTLNHPYFNKTLASKGRLLTNYYAVTHPSQPNYISMISGSTFGVHTDFDYNLDGQTIVDRLEERSIGWKSYQEDYPGNCFLGSTYGRYARKHNPFLSFTSISHNASRCAHIVNSMQLYLDMQSGNLPEYIFYTPTLDNDGHDTSLDYIAGWLDPFLNELLNSGSFDDTLFIITFDEDEGHITIPHDGTRDENDEAYESYRYRPRKKHHGHHRYGYTREDNVEFSDLEHRKRKTRSSRAKHHLELVSTNQVYALLIGPGMTPGSTDNNEYSHYSHIATIEKYWGVTSLYKNDKNANPFHM